MKTERREAVGMRMSDGKKIQKGCPLAAGGTCIKFLCIKNNRDIEKRVMVELNEREY